LKVRLSREENKEKFEQIDQRFDGVDQRFDAVDQRFEGLISEVRGLRNWMELNVESRPRRERRPGDARCGDRAPATVR
jgi:hypothetical protein